MPKLRSPGHILGDLIKRYYQRRIARSRNRDRSPPRLRLQDWQVVDRISVGRSDYVLLCRVRDPRRGYASLTAREREAARLASTGASSKEIAHVMGIRDSTVGVFLLRASRRLGAVGRKDLIRILRAGPRQTRRTCSVVGDKQ
jgi:DNA-binding CsgD family transcriptional regulator